MCTKEKIKEELVCTRCRKNVTCCPYETGDELACDCQNTLYTDTEFRKELWVPKK